MAAKPLSGKKAGEVCGGGGNRVQGAKPPIRPEAACPLQIGSSIHGRAHRHR